VRKRFICSQSNKYFSFGFDYIRASDRQILNHHYSSFDLVFSVEISLAVLDLAALGVTELHYLVKDAATRRSTLGYFGAFWRFHAL
jgi:hypothetical protein